MDIFTNREIPDYADAPSDAKYLCAMIRAVDGVVYHASAVARTTEAARVIMQAEVDRQIAEANK